MNAVPPRAGASSRRELGPALGRGFLGRCPRCGEGRIFRAYLKVAEACPVCGEELFHQRADDAPAYLTMLIIGHFIVSGIVATESWLPDLPVFPLALGWSALTALASLALLPRVKGALVGYQWALRMHGFGGTGKADE